jgi:hypothetical protein
MKRSIIFWGLALGALLFASVGGAAGVKVTPLIDKRDAVVEKLVTNWQDYEISFYQWGGTVPGVLLFDPKNDNKVLRVGKNWTKITTQQELSSAIERGKMYKVNMFPILSSITGPDGTVWGYVVTMSGQVYGKAADANTIDISPPRDPRPASR